MMKHENFAAMILTHGRPNKQHTLRALRREGYTGRVVIVIDNEDETASEYRRLYEDKVYVFDKAAIDPLFDPGDNFQERRSVIYARNATWQIARELGVQWFLQLDDDYSDFRFKANANLEYADKTKMSCLDDIFDCMLDFLDGTNALSVAMMQGGDFIGGKNSGKAKKLALSRKCMNTFFCNVDRPFMFCGKLNDDVNTYVMHGQRGHVMLSVPNLAINQAQTQTSSGWLTDIYKMFGTYVKSFYTVMMAPSCVHICEMGSKERRLHHSISWNNAVPLILRAEHRKPDNA